MADRQIAPADLSALRRCGAWDRVISAAPLGELGQVRLAQPGSRWRARYGVAAVALTCGALLAASLLTRAPTLDPAPAIGRAQPHHHR